MFRKKEILFGHLLTQTSTAMSFLAGQRNEHMAENAKLGAKNHQKGDVENRPDVEDNYLGSHALKPHLNTEIKYINILFH
jgi:hypothetical protein